LLIETDRLAYRGHVTNAGVVGLQDVALFMACKAHAKGVLHDARAGSTHTRPVAANILA